MADNEKKQTDPGKQTEAIADQAQKAIDREVEQGFRGVEVDPTPNENYTVAGVTSGAPTPESDPEQAAQVGSRKFAR